MKKLLDTLLPKIYGLYFNILVYFNAEKAAREAFFVFCKVRKGKVKEKQKTFLDPARYNVVDMAGLKIQTYKWPGTGPSVLLVHGWESNTWRWHKLIKKLQEENFNIIAFDAPGHGYSSGEYLYVPLYAEILQQIITLFRPPYIVGHSVGGMTILYNEFLHPKNTIEKIVTIGSPAEFYKIMDHFEDLLGLNKMMSRALERYILKRFGFTVNAFTSINFVKENNKKGLLFHDRLDTIAPYDASEKVHAQWKDSRLITTEGLGHSMHQEEINMAIITFLKE